MRTIDFETILAQSTQLAGLDRYNISEQSFAQIRDFANNRIQTAWEFDSWPDLIRSTRFPVVNQDSMHYVIIPNDGTVTNSEGTFKIDVGTVMQVTVEDPRTKGKVKEVGFSFDEYEELVSGSTVQYKTVKRLIIDITGQTEVFLTYRINCPEFVGDLWKSDNEYVANESVYYAYNNTLYFAPTSGGLYPGKKGNFWKCVRTTGNAPTYGLGTYADQNDGDDWKLIKIPAIFGQYIIKGIHADWLKSEMQIEYGNAIAQEANQLLDLEVHKAIVQQGIQPRLKFNQIY